MLRLLIITFICAFVFKHCDAIGTPLCPVNELWEKCGRWCEPTCDNPPPVACPAIPCDTPPGCTCLEGYVRNGITDKCIKLDECPFKCGLGEAKVPCGRICEGTCTAPWKPAICETLKCAGEFCACDLAKDLVRCQRRNKCIHIQNCHKHVE